jgi:hypothetical protein
VTLKSKNLKKSSIRDVSRHVKSSKLKKLKKAKNTFKKTKKTLRSQTPAILSSFTGANQVQE